MKSEEERAQQLAVKLMGYTPQCCTCAYWEVPTTAGVPHKCLRTGRNQWSPTHWCRGFKTWKTNE